MYFGFSGFHATVKFPASSVFSNRVLSKSLHEGKFICAVSSVLLGYLVIKCSCHSAKVLVVYFKSFATFKSPISIRYLFETLIFSRRKSANFTSNLRRYSILTALFIVELGTYKQVIMTRENSKMMIRPSASWFSASSNNSGPRS